MTWNETHQRTRILRQVEAHAAVDMTGTLPWRESWAPYFGDRGGLLVALRCRWERMGDARPDAIPVRRSNAGVLRILQREPA